MAIEIFNATGIPANLVSIVVEKMTALGIDCVKGSGNNTILINKWNDIQNVEIPFVPATTSNTLYVFAVRTDPGKELFFALNPTNLTTHGNCYPAINFFNNGVKLVSTSSATTSFLPSSFELTAGLYEYKEDIKILPCLLFGNASNNPPVDISEVGLYHANGLLSPNAIYKSGNKEFLAINQFFLLKI